MADQDLTAILVQERLGLGEEAMAWLNDLQTIGPPPEPVMLPSANDAAVLLARLGVPSAQIAEVVDARPSPNREPALWWVFERCHNLLVQDMGGAEPLRPWPALPMGLGASGRYFYVWVFVATVPDVRRFHAARGIPDEVSWDTLADLGQHMALHQRMYGEGGLGSRNWITLHWRGGIYRLGRLQFNRGRINYDDATLERLGVGFRRGSPALGVHIPESGPLLPEACDASFRHARDFFARHFPEVEYRIATCGSWLLDDQLAEYLPETSNIIRFQRRFQVMPGGRECDQDIVRFVFGRATIQLDELPQRTTLERAIVRHLAAGRHWQGRSGWCEV